MPFTVSIIMPAYNCEKYIRQAVESVLQQNTNFPIELIIGEDSSTDNTRAIVQEFENKYPRIIKPIYLESNVGVVRNRFEFCYPKLSGKYIACIDSDDY